MPHWGGEGDSIWQRSCLKARDRVASSLQWSCGLAVDGDGGESKRAGLVRRCGGLKGRQLRIGGHHLSDYFLGYLLFLILSELPTDLFAIYSGDSWEISRSFDSQKSP